MEDSPTLLGLLENFHGGKVVCLGDLMVDRFIYGAIERISPEAPIPIIQIEREETMLGGVGNVARNVSAAGGRARLLAVHGEDEAGENAKDLVSKTKNVEADLFTEPARKTTLKTRYIAAGQQMLRTDHETRKSISTATCKHLLSKLESALKTGQILVLSDYGKGVLDDQMIRGAIELAQAAGVAIIADPKRRDLAIYSGIDFLKPNRTELAAATGMPCDNDQQIVLAARTMMDHHDIGSMLVSRSEQGLSFIPREGNPVHLPTRAPEVFDVSGAGDTVVAIFALSLAVGASIDQAAYLANLAAGIVVGKVGTAAVDQEELAGAVKAEELNLSETKLVSANTLQTDMDRWRVQGLRIGFTNGCFDLLHPGHISLLEEAKTHCDRLIVAINDDASVRRLEKGENRPIQTADARAVVLTSLTTVDRVIIYADDTPIPLLQQVRPDILIKGGDYELCNVVGGDLVQGYGGDVKLAKFIDGHSSTAAISRMAANPEK